MPTQEKFASIRKGLLEFLVLRLVASDKMYVADMLQRLSTTEFATQEGTLYPLLRRLETQGLLASEWREEDKRNKRFYHLSKEGKSVLKQLTSEWNAISQSLDKLLNGVA